MRDVGVLAVKREALIHHRQIISYVILTGLTPESERFRCMTQTEKKQQQKHREIEKN